MNHALFAFKMRLRGFNWNVTLQSVRVGHMRTWRIRDKRFPMHSWGGLSLAAVHAGYGSHLRYLVK